MSDNALVENLLKLQRPRMAARKFMSLAGEAVVAYCPCFMMSPITAGQLLSLDKDWQFDLLVIDEASQLPTAEAIGVVARARRLAVVGDTKQMPPSSMFRGVDPGHEDDEDGDEGAEPESILDRADGLYTTRSLLWHYRSRHESLIQFSNREFYNSRLVVSPSRLDESDQGIKVIQVGEGRFVDKINIVEAVAVVDQAILAMRREVGRISPRSLGVVAMNAQQTDCIEEEWRRRIDSLPESDPARKYLTLCQDVGGRISSPFFKNLENVQGDERDIIILSTTYGPGSDGRQMQNFGLINKKSGWRRLNVLFTRARDQVIAVTSLRLGEIRDRKGGDGGQYGPAVLRDYLIEAINGDMGRARETGREPDSDFEREVGEVLTANGIKFVYQLGVERYAIDIAICHPTRPRSFCLAIECDGASYHSHKSARDRDRLRQERLEGMGWIVYRIWSTDWFQRRSEMESRLIERVRLALAEAEEKEPAPIQNKWKERKEDQEEIFSDSPISAPEDLAVAEEIDRKTVDERPCVGLGSQVVVWDENVKRPRIWTISSKLSLATDDGPLCHLLPIAKALMGRRIGDVVFVESPDGNRRMLRIQELSDGGEREESQTRLLPPPATPARDIALIAEVVDAEFTEVNSEILTLPSISIENSSIESDDDLTVDLGVMVRIRYADTGDEAIWLLVAWPGANEDTGELYYLTPLGRALRGKRRHDEIELKLGGKNRVIQILDLIAG